jgi:hypothetical protein
MLRLTPEHDEGGTKEDIEKLKNDAGPLAIGPFMVAVTRA